MLRSIGVERAERGRATVAAEPLGAEEWLVAVQGDADLATAAALEHELASAAAAEHLIVDLRATTFFDSTSLGALVAAHRRLRARGGRVSVVSTDASVTKVFEITGLDRVFALEPTVAAARG